MRDARSTPLLGALLMASIAGCVDGADPSSSIPAALSVGGPSALTTYDGVKACTKHFSEW